MPSQHFCHGSQLCLLLRLIFVVLCRCRALPSSCHVCQTAPVFHQTVQAGLATWLAFDGLLGKRTQNGLCRCTCFIFAQMLGSTLGHAGDSVRNDSNSCCSLLLAFSRASLLWQRKHRLLIHPLHPKPALHHALSDFSSLVAWLSP